MSKTERSTTAGNGSGTPTGLPDDPNYERRNYRIARYGLLATIVGLIIALVGLVPVFFSDERKASDDLAQDGSDPTGRTAGSVTPTGGPASVEPVRHPDAPTRPTPTTSRSGPPPTTRPPVVPTSVRRSTAGLTTFGRAEFTLVGLQSVFFAEGRPRWESDGTKGGDLVWVPDDHVLSYDGRSDVDAVSYDRCLNPPTTQPGVNGSSGGLVQGAVYCRREKAPGLVSFVQLTDVAGISDEPSRIRVLVWFQRPAG